MSFLGSKTTTHAIVSPPPPPPPTLFLSIHPRLGPKMTQRLAGVAGTQEWQGFEREARPYLDVFAAERDKLVYLTSDSPDTLTTWDRSAVYIIGGIVDRNRLKGATYTKAQAQGIATARFPLQEYVTLGSTHVLAVNHVFDILLEFQRTNDWRTAFGAVLPQRKSPSWKPPGEETGQGEWRR